MVVQSFRCLSSQAAIKERQKHVFWGLRRVYASMKRHVHGLRRVYASMKRHVHQSMPV